jgi:hypothetical protein
MEFPKMIPPISDRNKMKKTTIELTEDQYFFLKEKALELQKQRKHYSIVSIIRDLVETDMKSWRKNTKGQRSGA